MLNKKLNWLCSRAINVAQSMPWLWRAEKHFRPLTCIIDTKAVASIIGRFAGNPEFADGRKYLRLNWYLRDSLARAVMLGLDRSPPLRVLDLGSGAGYFLLACRHFGHSGVGFDLPSNAFYAAMFSEFGLARVEGTILPLTPLHGVDGRFDLITAFAVTFSKAGRVPGAPEWSKTKWHYFLSDLRKLLRPNGRVFLRLNISDVRGLHDEQVYECFSHLPDGFSSAIMNRREVMFKLRS